MYSIYILYRFTFDPSSNLTFLCYVGKVCFHVCNKLWMWYLHLLFGNFVVNYYDQSLSCLISMGVINICWCFIHLKMGEDYCILVILWYFKGSEKHGCELCGRAYKRKQHLVRHLRFECGKEAQFECTFCSYKSRQRETLKVHIIMKHPDSKIILTNQI